MDDHIVVYIHICIDIHMSTAKPPCYTSPVPTPPPRLFAPLSLSDFLRVLLLNWTPTVQFVRTETETCRGTRWNPGGKSKRQTAMKEPEKALLKFSDICTAIKMETKLLSNFSMRKREAHDKSRLQRYLISWYLQHRTIRLELSGYHYSL